jgi:hypothetical protein
MGDTERFQSFPRPPHPYTLFTADWDDDLVIVDTPTEMQRQAQNEEIHMWILSRAREMYLQTGESRLRFPSPPPDQCSRGTISDDGFGGMVVYL